MGGRLRAGKFVVPLSDTFAGKLFCIACTSWDSCVIEAMSTIRFSVIVPLIEHRGFALQALAGWQRQHDFPAHKLEIIAVSASADRDLEREFQILLPRGS